MAWLAGWPYRKEITITGQSGAGTDYQVEFSIGDSAGGDFHLEGHCTNFPQDIRITDNDETTLIDHWVEDLTADPIKMWVEVADDLGTNKTIYIYYGKSGETTVSNIDNTFIFGDDFNAAIDTEKWDNTDGFSQASGAVYASGTKDLKSLNDVAIRNTIIESNMKMVSSTYPHVASVLSAMQATTSQYYASGMRNNDSEGLYLYKDDAGNPYTDGAPLTVDANYHKYTLKYAGSTDIYLYIDDANEKTISNNSYTTGNIWLKAFAGTGTNYWNYIFVRKYNSPEPAFSSAGSEEVPTITSLFDGKIIIKNVTTNLLDGKTRIKSITTNLLDGIVSIQSTSTDLVDGKVWIKDVGTDLVDGKVQIKSVTTDLLDGKVSIQNMSTDLVDGKVQIKSVTTDLLDGKVLIKDVGTDLVDGKVQIKSVTTDLLDGKVQIQNVTTNLFDGKILIEDDITDLVDGKVWIKDVGTDLVDGKVIITSGGGWTGIINDIINPTEINGVQTLNIIKVNELT